MLVLWLEGRGLLASDTKLLGGSHSSGLPGIGINNPGGSGGGVGLTKCGTS